MKKLLSTLLVSLLYSFSYSQTTKNISPVKLDLFLKKSNDVKPVMLTNENIFTPKDLIISIPENKPPLPEKKILISPKISKLPIINLIPVNKAISVVANDNKLTVPVVQPLAQINSPSIRSSEVSLINLLEIKEDEYKMIQALIFFEIQKNYDVALSLFNELITTTSFGSQSILHYAESARELGLNSEYRHKILNLLSEVQDKSIKTKTILSIVQNIQSFETADLKIIDPLVKTFNINVTKNYDYLYKQAKYFIADGNLADAETALSQIGSDSQFYADSVLLSASLNYRKGEITKAISKLEKSIPQIENDKKSIVRNSSIATIARLYFQIGQYKKSYDSYLKIDRSSPLWLQTVVEQAWAQILVGDHIGAAGNMFSLHTEIFKKAYVPESYIVRSIGYLNLCQYGDALHVLTDLDNRFKKTHESLIKFQNENTNPMTYFDLVKTWFKNSELSEINALPRSFISELAVHPSFTNIQKQINQHEEENSKIEKFIVEFSNKENLLKQYITKIRNEIKTLKNQGVSPDILTKAERKISSTELEIQIVHRSQDALKKVHQVDIQKLNSEKEVLRISAANAIKNHYTELTENLGKFLDQEEILAYEVYSGAGEHIRYQMADGKINDRVPTSLTPEEKKSYKWKFRGEVWEDEIGHYRSSLKNVCANDEIAHTKGDQ